nr:reverse transcriptase domain-containing protein [Tanacetum cinerariifolium]
MSEEDEDKTAFYTDQGTYCYVKMPFGLKNAGYKCGYLLKRRKVLVVPGMPKQPVEILEREIKKLKQSRIPIVKETDTQEKDKNKAKNDKTEHKMEKIEKDKAIRSRKVKRQSPRSTKVNPRNVKVNPDKAEAEKWRKYNLRGQISSPAIVEPLRIELPFLKDQFQEDPPVDPPEVSMADNRAMAELLQAPTEGYEDAIVILKIAANNFELRHGLINLVQNKQFFEHDKEDPHAHIRYFNKITSMMRVPNVPSSSIKLMLFPFSLEGAARIWLEKEAPRSILIWDDLVTKFINQFFPPLKMTNLRNEITRFQQRFDESFYEAWDRFNDLLWACPHHGFFELHQLDTFYNALNNNDQDSLNSAAGGNFLDRMPQECLKIIESKSKVPISSEVSELKDMVRALLLDKKNQSSAHAQSSTPTPFKAIEPGCVICSGTHSYQNYPATSGNDYRDNIQDQGQNVQNQCQGLQTQIANLTDMLSKFVSSNTASSSGSGTLPSNTVTNPKEDLKGLTTRSGVAYQGPTIPTQSKVVKQRTEVTKNQVQTLSSQSTAPIQPLVIQSKTQTPVSEPVVALVSDPIPYPSRRDNEKRRDQANEQIDKFYKIFKEMSFKISFTDALIPMPKFASTLNALIGNKEKLSEMARTPMNEHCSTVILNKLPRKLGDPGKFLIPCEFPGMDECLALADLDVSAKVGVFHFPADFVVVNFEPDPRVPLILGRCFLKSSRAMIDVHKGKLTLHIRNEAITYNLDHTVKYSANYNQMTANKIDVICEMYSQEVLGFSDVTMSGNPTPDDDPIVSTTSPTLTLFGDSDFLLFEEADAFLGLEDDPDSAKINPFYYDPERDILLLEAILNSEPLPPLPNHKQYMPSYKKELKVCEAKTIKSSVDEPPEVELKDCHTSRRGLGRIRVRRRDVVTHLNPWVSPVHCVPKKGGFIVVENEENELIPTRLVTGWRVCIDYRKLNEATRKDHFPLRFMDQMLERLAGNEYYCFLDGFSRYFQIPIDPRDQEKTTFTCPYGTFAYQRMPFGLCNSPGTFQRCMLAIFHDMVEKTMEVFMDDFSVFGNSFENCLSRLDKMLQMCEDTNLSLNWEKSHFMVKEGIALCHKISKNGIEVDRAKVDVIAKLPHPITVKGELRTSLGVPAHLNNWNTTLV